MNLLIFGAKGQLGIDLMQHASGRQWHPVGADLPECDITNSGSIGRVFEQAAPVAAVINAAAYTAVDQAETDEKLAYAVNRDGPAALAQRCRAEHIPLIHISTDYVFDGRLTRPYRPSDNINPLGVYGKSKAAGEAAVRKYCAQHVIVRTAWLYSLHRSNFVKTMLRLGSERKTLQVVDDQVGSPTYAGDLADALLAITAYLVQNKNGWGTYHFCNTGALTWYAFARKIFTLARPVTQLKVKEVIPILTQHYPTPAPRPQYSVLDCTSLVSTFGIVRRPWQTALKEMLVAHYSSGD